MPTRSSRPPTDFLTTLRESGVSVWDDVLQNTMATRTADEVDALYQRGLFAPAGIGHSRTVNRAVRGDERLWLLPDDDDATFTAHDGLRALRDVIVSIARALSPMAFVRLDALEMMATHYAPGSFYVPHVDRFAGSIERVFSYVYFLNANWVQSDGGALRILSPNAQTITPLLDRLVVFHTSEVLHEVQLTWASRRAITGWMGNVPSVIA